MTETENVEMRPLDFTTNHKHLASPAPPWGFQVIWKYYVSRPEMKCRFSSCFLQWEHVCVCARASGEGLRKGAATPPPKPLVLGKKASCSQNTASVNQQHLNQQLHFLVFNQRDSLYFLSHRKPGQANHVCLHIPPISKISEAHRRVYVLQTHPHGYPY